LTVQDLPPLAPGTALPPAETNGSIPEGGLDLTQVVEGMGEKLLRQALEQATGVKAEAARLLGLKPSALYYKLEKYGIEG
jgi:two-component system response regulator HydG